MTHLTLFCCVINDCFLLAPRRKVEVTLKRLVLRVDKGFSLSIIDFIQACNNTLSATKDEHHHLTERTRMVSLINCDDCL